MRGGGGVGTAHWEGGIKTGGGGTERGEDVDSDDGSAERVFECVVRWLID